MTLSTEAQTQPVCKFCRSESVVRYGTYKGIQRYWCKACNRKFVANAAMPGKRIPPDRVGMAVSLFYDGLSTAAVSKQLGEIYGIYPSKSTIYEWIVEYTKKGHAMVRPFKVHTGDTWVADEIVLRIGGRNVWVWDVMDARTRYLLASRLSTTRTAGDAEAVFQQAARVASHPPRVVVTDRLASYIGGIEGAFGSETKHVQSQGIRAEVNNNLSERLQGTIKQRTKVMRGLKDTKTARLYLDGFTLNYNYLRPHEALGNKPPAMAAGIEYPFREWEDIVRERLEDERLKLRPPRANPFRSRTFARRRGGL